MWRAKRNVLFLYCEMHFCFMKKLYIKHEQANSAKQIKVKDVIVKMVMRMRASASLGYYYCHYHGLHGACSCSEHTHTHTIELVNGPKIDMMPMQCAHLYYVIQTIICDCNGH